MFRIAIALLLAAPLAAQASVTSYGRPCPNTNRILITQGLPRLGTDFTVLLSAGGCIFFHCSQCGGPDVLIVGASPDSTTVSLPGLGLGGNGCTILARPDVALIGDSNYEVRLQIPNNTRLLGLRFYLQSVTPWWWCSWFGLEFSDGLECVIGP